MDEDTVRLIQVLNNCTMVELERLRKCFQYDYKTYPEKRVQAGELLDHIEAIIKQKQGRS